MSIGAAGGSGGRPEGEPVPAKPVAGAPARAGGGSWKEEERRLDCSLGRPRVADLHVDLYVDEEDDRMVPGAGQDGSGSSERHAGDGRPVVGEVVAVEVK